MLESPPRAVAVESGGVILIPALGAYYRPESLEEAVGLLAREPRARILAGGTDLLLETEPVEALVDVTRLGLDTLRDDPDALLLGSTLRVEALRCAPEARAWADGVLVGACLNFGTLQVRNMATIGGNVAHALPAADLVPALLVLDASVELARAAPSGAILRRRLPLDGFATGPFTTQLLPGELITSISVPGVTRGYRAQFRKIGRVLKDLAQVNCAVALDLHGGAVREARIAVGAVHPTVTRVPAAEAELRGGTPGDATWQHRIARAVDAVRDLIRPLSDLRASREWRRHVCGVLVRRSLEYASDPRTRGRVPCFEDGPLYRVHAGAAS